MVVLPEVGMGGEDILVGECIWVAGLVGESGYLGGSFSWGVRIYGWQF